MKHPMIVPRGSLKASTILRHFPSPVPYSHRAPGLYSLSGAYLFCRGLPEEKRADELFAFPSDDLITEQLGRDNRLLRIPAIGMVDTWGGNPKILLADLFAEALSLVEGRGHLHEACLILDAALFLARRDLQTGSKPLRKLEIILPRHSKETASA